jgi:hypothetical protein
VRKRSVGIAVTHPAIVWRLNSRAIGWQACNARIYNAQSAAGLLPVEHEAGLALHLARFAVAENPVDRARPS